MQAYGSLALEDNSEGGKVALGSISCVSSVPGKTNCKRTWNGPVIDASSWFLSPTLVP